MTEHIIIPPHLTPPETVVFKINDFIKVVQPNEVANGSKLFVHFDEKSKAYYTTCHIPAKALVVLTDLEATLDGDDEDEIYKLNREITEDQIAFKRMVEDAYDGRSFEDIVIEYDRSYKPQKPLKVYGGQHRVKAISKAEKNRGNTAHGIRVYFELNREQKVEIATINNTSIAVPNDLLDRMREQLLGAELRTWCQNVGLLDQNEDFADRRSPDTPTVRIARTLIVNFFFGMAEKNIDDYHQPVICKSGGVDEDYMKVRQNIRWNDVNLLEMGKQFAQLNKAQRNSVTSRTDDSFAEYARKALSLTVVASWAYAAGLFQQDPKSLQHLYNLPNTVSPPEDPLNAKALSLARLKGLDPDTYRGLGTRTGTREQGRMLELFLVFALKATKKRITKELANAAIQSYEAKRAVFEAQKVLGRI